MSATHKCRGCGALGAFWAPLPGGRQTAIRGPVAARCEACGGEQIWESATTAAQAPRDKSGPQDRLTQRGVI